MESFNILAETGGSAENTVVVGGHLDSVLRGRDQRQRQRRRCHPGDRLWFKEAGIAPANKVGLRVLGR